VNTYFVQWTSKTQEIQGAICVCADEEMAKQYVIMHALDDVLDFIEVRLLDSPQIWLLGELED